MAFPRARRLPLLLGAVGVVALAGEGRARADKNDLQLLNLCPPRNNPVAQIDECGWVDRDSMTGHINGTKPDMDGESRFRSQMSELGFAIAPRVMTPADTLGFAGFQFSAEVGYTKINPDRTQIGGRSYWDGIAGVKPPVNKPEASVKLIFKS